MNLFRPVPPPGFDDFWTETVSEAESSPLDYSLGPEVEVRPTQGGQTDPGRITDRHRLRMFRFRGVRGDSLNGWIAVPTGARGRSPAFLWIAPYGRESVMPNQYGTREGFVSLSFNFFGLDAFHQEKYAPSRGYFSEGVLDRRSWVFHAMFQNAILALRVLSDLPETDPKRLGSMGMSQGGGMSIWLGAWSHRLGAVCADMPFLGAMSGTLTKSVYRYPLKELMDYASTTPKGLGAVLRTIEYYDTLNQATRCIKPTLVSVGLKDPAVKPIQARSIFEALSGPKKLVEYPGGHDWDPEMVENNRRWLVDNL